MSTIIPTMPQTTVAAPAIAPTPPARAAVVVQDRMTIPSWVNNLESYREWAESEDYPQSGWVSFLDGVVWVDMSMEEFLTHNQIKQAFNTLFGIVLTRQPTGCFVPDRMLLVHVAANLATEPDGLFYLWQTMQSGRLQLVPGKKILGYTVLEGSPDVILEIVSEGSVTKDLVTLRELYWKAEIPEYWLVDVRRDQIRFEILKRQSDGYQPVPAEDGWVRSEILGHSLRIERSMDPTGLPQFVVAFKP